MGADYEYTAPDNGRWHFDSGGYQDRWTSPDGTEVTTYDYTGGRLDVYSWRRPRAVLHTYLDVDEIAVGQMKEVPEPLAVRLPAWAQDVCGDTGTLVVWSRCDRLDHRRASTIAPKLFLPLGRVFRYFLWNGVTILVNSR